MSFDLSEFRAEDNDLPFTNAVAIHHMLVQGQNLYEVMRDLLRDELIEMCKIPPKVMDGDPGPGAGYDDNYRVNRAWFLQGGRSRGG